VDHVIESVKELKRNSVKFKLHIVGAGSEESSLFKYTKEIGLEKDVIFHGSQSQDWIASFLPGMDVAIAPLTGRALLEIALAALPVVAYDVDWHDEIVVEGVTGVLVEYLNSSALGHAVFGVFLLGNSSRKEMGNQMRLKALELSDPLLLSSRQNNFFDNLCNK
jgi:glycosyltransferase involved in cell wall biosynthesis